MKTPQEEKHLILEPTIVVITDSVHTKFFYADNDEFRHLENIAENMTFVRGGEGHGKSTPGTTSSTDDSDRMNWEGEHRKHLFAAVNDFLKSKLANKEVKNIILVVPEEHKNELADELSVEVKKHVTRTVTKNLTNHPLDKILSAIQ